MNPDMLASITGVVQAGNEMTGLGEQASYWLGDLTGYNDKLAEDQYRQYKKQMDLQQEYNVANMATQQDYQKQMYDYTYEKTSPKAQLERIKEAGLSPALMYGGGAGGAGGATTGNAGLPNVSGGNPQSIASMRRDAQRNYDLSSIMQMQETASRIKVNEAQAKNIDADTANKDVQKGNIEADTTLKTAQVGNIEAEKKLKGLQADYQETQNKIAKGSSEALIGRAYMEWTESIGRANIENFNAEILKDSVPTLKEQNKANLKLAIARIAEINTNVKLDNQKIENLKKEIDMLQSDIDLNVIKGNNLESVATSKRIEAIAKAVGVGVQSIVKVVELFTKFGSITESLDEVIMTTKKGGSTTTHKTIEKSKSK